MTLAASHIALPWWRQPSFVMLALTSVGFGEITPVTPPARALVMLQQVTGVLYVAILIARLTGLYGRRSRPD